MSQKPSTNTEEVTLCFPLSQSQSQNYRTAYNSQVSCSLRALRPSASDSFSRFWSTSSSKLSTTPLVFEQLKESLLYCIVGFHSHTPKIATLSVFMRGHCIKMYKMNSLICWQVSAISLQMWSGKAPGTKQQPAPTRATFKSMKDGQWPHALPPSATLNRVIFGALSFDMRSTGRCAEFQLLTMALWELGSTWIASLKKSIHSSG